MKHFFVLLFLFCAYSFPILSQKQTVRVDTAERFGVTPPLKNIPEALLPREKRVVKNKLRRHKHRFNPIPLKSSDVRQLNMGIMPNDTPIVKWEGVNYESQNVLPPDPSGAVGPNHYVQMVNLAMQIFDKEGNSVYGPTSLSSVFPGSQDDGDPIVMYDKFAERWFISQFQSNNNEILIAISTSPDPLGSWYYYNFGLSEFPDYPKYSIWKNGYFMTANAAIDNAVCFERDEMLAGNPSARKISMDIPNLTTSGFFSALPSHFDGDSLNQNIGNCNLFYFQDDGWTGNQDEIKVWDIDINWSAPESSSIGLSQTIPVADFNSAFDVNWNDVPQPNTTQRIDAVPGAFMYMAQYKTFSNHHSVILCHTINVDPADDMLAGIRWYELRRNNGSENWEVYQQGTYAPDDGEHRFMGSMVMDNDGNIALAYSIASENTFPSLAYTGRRVSDPLGEMTLEEEIAFEGTASQTSSNRYGDYAHMVLDPSDQSTFWYTGEFIGNNGWKTGIFAYEMTPVFDNDIGVIGITEPTSGNLSNAESVSVNIRNFGNEAQFDFDIALVFNGDTIIESFNDTVYPSENSNFTFSTTIDLSVIGKYNIATYTLLNEDSFNKNDTLKSIVEHLHPYDFGVVEITEPISGDVLGSEETVTVLIKNFGYLPVDSIPINFFVNESDTFSTIYQDSVFPNETVQVSFNQLVDMSNIGIYNITAYSDLDNDTNFINDTTTIEIEKSFCLPTSNCIFGDEITFFEFNEISNISGCGNNGYEDYTFISSDLSTGETYTVQIETNEQFQFISIWIDYNDNNYFEPNELLVQNHEFDFETSFEVTIPTGVNQGEHLMRVRLNYDDASDDPCEDFIFGETEDYMVNIIVPTASEFVYKGDYTLYYNQKQNRIVFSFDDLKEENIYFEIYNSIGQLVKKGNKYYNDEIKTIELNKGFYLLNFYFNNKKIKSYKFLK